jgi:hypothetical protein
MIFYGCSEGIEKKYRRNRCGRWKCMKWNVDDVTQKNDLGENFRENRYGWHKEKNVRREWALHVNFVTFVPFLTCFRHGRNSNSFLKPSFLPLWDDRTSAVLHSCCQKKNNLTPVFRTHIRTLFFLQIRFWPILHIQWNSIRHWLKKERDVLIDKERERDVFISFDASISS